MKRIHPIPTFALILVAILSPLHSEEISSSAETMLLRQLDEERLAYQLYTALGEVHPSLQQFQNIPRSESRHFNSLAQYWAKQHSDLKTPELEGAFIYLETQQLYDQLLEKGKKSPQAALQVGVEVEELDIRDLDEALAASPEKDLRLIYENLRRGSENHLRAFSRSGVQGKGKGFHGNGNGNSKGPQKGSGFGSAS